MNKSEITFAIDMLTHPNAGDDSDIAQATIIAVAVMKEHLKMQKGTKNEKV